jgi:amidophosphoribosyltransferase
VHVRISCPPTAWPCYYGIDTPTRSELIASSHSVSEIGKYLAADSIGYVSLAGLVTAVDKVEQDTLGSETPDAGHCHACFSGEYTIPLGGTGERRRLRLVMG